MRYVLGTLGAALLVVTYLLRSAFHDLLFFVYVHPALFEAFVVWLLIHVFVLRQVRGLMGLHRGAYQTTQHGQVELRSFHYRWLWWVSAPLLVVLLATGFLFGNGLSLVTLASETTYHPVETLPESGQSIRLMPREVAARYARDALQLSQYRLGRSALVEQDGELTWQFVLVPDGLVLKFTRPNLGLISVRASTQQKNGRLLERPLAVGEGMLVMDNLWIRLYQHRFWVGTEKPYYVVRQEEQGTEVYTVVPAIAYSFRFRWGLLYTVPRFAGVFLVDSTGRIAFLEPEEAQRHPVTAGTRLYPEGLARLTAHAYAYRRGLTNKLFLHADQVEIQDVPETENRQPFLMQTQEGMKWFVSTEPYGQSHGIFKIFLVDAVTGRVDLQELDAAASLTGPVRALDYVRRANPIVDWSRFVLVEPLPFVRDGVLYWKVTVAPEDSAGIAYQAFVNSTDNAVTALETDQEIRAFVLGTRPPAATQPPAPGVALPPGQALTPEQTQALVEELRRRLREMEALLDQLEHQAPPE
ncbi:hypothetical protein [Limnochorda pilosa]|uniref:Uncharacterized protein n=1 Tax=Limnochorda pilosa TaxID=1555112 RepID=A0A0K2SJL9_LIMPI|nr:hypothetical protein [Limnochorda pilosa]BAS27202.1 hypothetical protein LIP_1351 [Limnochorda pilosa]